jgi:hypothetical protein
MLQQLRLRRGVDSGFAGWQVLMICGIRNAVNVT